MNQEIAGLGHEKLIIRDNLTLKAQYNALQQGDIIVGRLRLRESEESLLLDLCGRGIHLIPSGLSQLVQFGAVTVPNDPAFPNAHRRRIRYGPTNQIHQIR